MTTTKLQTLTRLLGVVSRELDVLNNGVWSSKNMRASVASFAHEPNVAISLAFVGMSTRCHTGNSRWDYAEQADKMLEEVFSAIDFLLKDNAKFFADEELEVRFTIEACLLDSDGNVQRRNQEEDKVLKPQQLTK